MSGYVSASAEWRGYWTVPVAAALGYSTSVLHVYGFGPFIEPLQQEFGWSRAQISAGITIPGVVAAIFCVPIGILVDRFGPRYIGLIGVPLMTASVALLGTATGSAANWFFLWGVIALANLWLQTTVWTSAVASRFEKSRGLAFAVTLSGAGFSQMVLPILAAALIGAYGWRSGFMGMSALWAVLVFPVLFLFFRGAQDEGRKRNRAARLHASSILPGVSVAEGLRSPAYYKLLLASGLFTFTVLGVVVHFVPILTDSGADPLAAAGIASFVGIFSLLGRLGTGLLLDRYPAHMIGAGVFLLPIIACVLLLTDGANPVSQSVAASIFGFTVGAEVDVVAYLVSRHFGLKNFGVFNGSMVGALSLGAAFGPVAAGAVYDMDGGYGRFLILTMAFMATSSLALASMSRPRFGVQPEPEGQGA